QPRPRRTLTRQHDIAAGGVLAHRRREGVERADAVNRRAVVRLLGADGIERVGDAWLLLLDPPDQRRVVRVHVDVAGARIDGGATPVDAADAAREGYRRLRRRAVLMEGERRERTIVGESSAPGPERLTRGGVLGRRVGGRHHVFFFETRLRQRRRLERERLRRRIPLAGHVALRNWTLLDAKHRLAVGAIEDEHVAALADGRE